MKRRDFLRLAGIIPLSCAFPGIGFSAAKTTTSRPRWDRTLVLVELTGGNDGLNTVVPYSDPYYYKLRPRLAVPRDDVLQLSPTLAFHPALKALMPAWMARELAVILGVGYADPNRSHFRSIDVWETGSDSQQLLDTGWIARLLHAHPPPTSFFADGIVLGRGAGPLRGSDARVVVMREPRRFLRQASQMRKSPERSSNPALNHLLTVQTDLYKAANKLENSLQQVGDPGIAFPHTRLGRQLQVAARLLQAGMGVPVIKVSHGSFDTHGNQRNPHNRLLLELAEGLGAFRQALTQSDLWDQVLVMTYSEFGRRAGENGSGGTDHGTAAPHFMLGGGVKGGLYGRQPSLTDLRDGDLRHHVDYRSLYRTVTERWWNLGNEYADGNRFPAIKCIA